MHPHLLLVLNMLAGTTTTEISKRQQPTSFPEDFAVEKEGGAAAGNARKAVEARIGEPVVTSQNTVQLNQVVTDMIEGVAAEQPSEEPDKEL